MVPVLELGSGFYMHDQYGKTYFPIFTIVDWADETTLELESKSRPETAEAVLDDDIPFDQATAARDQAIAAQRAAQVQQAANAQTKAQTGTTGAPPSAGLAAGRKVPRF
jgi:hypothetical protein